MAGSIRVQTTITIVDDILSAPEVIQTDKTYSFTAIERKRFSVASGTTVTVWDPTVDASEAASDFDFALFLSDGNVDLEMTVNEGDANEQIGTVRLTDKLPLMLGADDGYSGATQGLGGTLDVIDKLLIKEVSSATRSVQVILAT